MSGKQYHPVVHEFIHLVEEQGWGDDLHKAIQSARSKNVEFLNQHVPDYAGFLDYLNSLLYWVPYENFDGKEVYFRIVTPYFIFDQPTMIKHQNKVIPYTKAPPLTPLSLWIVKYAKSIGEFLDTPESLTKETLATFKKSPNYNMHEYMEPHGGWHSFNQFFARNFKPGYRPIAAITDQTVIVSPADSTFAGQWEIRSDSQVTVKHLHWKIEELLEGSPYKNHFKGGMFMHAFLGPTDYHRQHAPVGGTVLEARVIQAQAYLEVDAVKNEDGTHRLQSRRTLDAPDNLGYQFAQTRGLLVLDTPIGLVAVLPMGMAQVSSVILTAEVGVTLRKGEEISYFQFGGSDIVVIFQARSNVSFIAQPGVHYKTGTRIAQSYPAI